MKIDELISLLRDKNIKVTVEGGKLKAKGAAETMDAEFLHLLKAHKAEIVEYLDRSLDGVSYAAIEKALEKDYYRLTAPQKRLYILQKLDPGSIRYNLSTFLPLPADIDKDKIKQVARQLLLRHESLRCSFVTVDHEPFQRLHEDADVDIPHYCCAPEDAERCQRDFVKAFELERFPLIRLGILDITGGHCVLMIDMHHIITDGMSMELLAEEFWHLYYGRRLVPLPLQFKDYAEWVNSEGQQLRIGGQRAYWLKLLSGKLPVLELPYDFARPRMLSTEGGVIMLKLTKAEYQLLYSICKDNDVTLYMCLLAIVNIWLMKLSSQEDIIVGSPVTTRPHPDLEKVIGMFVNTLVVRNYPAGE